MPYPYPTGNRKIVPIPYPWPTRTGISAQLYRKLYPWPWT